MTQPKLTGLTGAGPVGLRQLLDAPAASGPAVQIRVGLVSVQVGGRLVVLADPGYGPDRADQVLPCAVTVPGLARAGLTGPALTATVGPGLIRLGARLVRIGRWWVPPQVRPASAVGLRPASVGSALTRPAVRTGLSPRTATRLAAAVGHLLAGRSAPAAERLVSVLGQGPGSTPAADDAVGGVLLAARGALRDVRAVEAVGRAVAQAAAGRTTALSAELLRHAAVGSATAAAVRAVQSADPATRAGLLALGASSGAATAWGIDLVRSGAAA